MINKSNKHLIVLAAPSGAGKSTIAKHIMSIFEDIDFSISATTRNCRPGEVNGKEYFFLEKDEFEQLIVQNKLVEYEEIYGNLYGTLKSEVDKKISEDRILLFDIDVKGALSFKKLYPDETVLIFIHVPVDVLEKRLRNRKTETEEQLQKRLARAELELNQMKEFEYIVLNEDLEKAKAEVTNIIATNCYS